MEVGNVPDDRADSTGICSHIRSLPGRQPVRLIDSCRGDLMIENLIVLLIVAVAVVLAARGMLKKDKGCNCPSKENCTKDKCDIMEN